MPRAFRAGHFVMCQSGMKADGGIPSHLPTGPWYRVSSCPARASPSLDTSLGACVGEPHVLRWQVINQALLRALCVARHRYLGEHFSRYFADLGLETSFAIGLPEALREASATPPDLLLCEYELLVKLPVEAWEGDGALAHVPLIVVSLTRPANEGAIDAGGIAGFFYLPTLDRAAAARLMHAAASASRHRYQSAPRMTASPPLKDVLVTG